MDEDQNKDTDKGKLLNVIMDIVNDMDIDMDMDMVMDMDMDMDEYKYGIKNKDINERQV